MKTTYINTSIPAEYSEDPGDFAIVAATAAIPEVTRINELRRQAKQKAVNDANQKGLEKQNEQDRAKYTAATQPRDIDGRFRKILARLKLNLGEQGTENLAKQIEKTEAAQIAGNYQLMHQNGNDLIKMIDSVKEGSLARGTTDNLRRGAKDLGRVLAYLPLPQGDPNAKVRFTDLPPASADLVRTMVDRVKEQLGQTDAAKYTQVLQEFMSGARNMDSDELATNMNKLLRVLA